MKKLKLTKGYIALVDDEDFNWLNQWKWSADKDGYAFRSIKKVENGKRTCIKMHRQIMNADKGQDVDHINHIAYDNRKSNLRLCSRTENLFNMRKTRGTSIFKGVSWWKRDKCWEVKIRVNGKTKKIGYFKNERHAAMAYDIWAKEIYGKFAVVNFNI